jgi:hypothetical protein
MKAFGLGRIENGSFLQVDDLPCILQNRSCKDYTVFVNAILFIFAANASK